MSLFKKFEIIGKGIYWKEENIMIFGDLHLGYEEYLLQRGFNIPRTQLEYTKKEFEKVFKQVRKLDKIILLGDVKHDFKRISYSESNELKEVFKIFNKNLKKNGEILIIKGNHDNILEPLIRDYVNVKLVDKKIIKDVLFLHGHKKSFEKNLIDLYDKKIKYLIIGHIHPAFVLEEDVKQEKYKCFLYGKNKKYGKNMILVPSFFPLVEGKDIRDLCEFDNFKVVLIDENGEKYDFGLMNKLKKN
jgi:hypothetical protein